MKAVNQQVIADFRAGGPISVDGVHRERIVLLTTTGARSGEPRTVPVMFRPSENGILVVASDNGSPRVPRWFRDLVANPAVHVEAPDAEYDARATVLDGEKRDNVWKRLTSELPMFLEQQQRAGRELPLIEISRV